MPLLAAIPVITIAWFFNVHLDGRPAERFGPYLTEGTCEAVRARVSARLDRGALPGTCYKVAVQINDQLTSD